MLMAELRGDGVQPVPRFHAAAVALDGFTVHPWSDDIIEDAPAKRRKRRPSISSVAREAAKAGLVVTGIEYKPDGSVTYHTGKPTPGVVNVNDNQDDGSSTDPDWN
jgi:hypothetical protein